MDLNYRQTVDYLYEQLPMFSKQGKDAIKKDLTNTLKLCEALGNPQEKFKSIHIAGTNGKGSTSHMLAAVLQDAGYKTGLYTSPHLVDFRERIRIGGKPVNEVWVTEFVTKHKALIEEVKPSFFEITVAMAFLAFAEAEVDIAVIETGLGGRLDSTNIITPLLSVITNISYDHKDILGDTLPEIAAEKAGIIKPNVPVVIGEQQEETARVFFEHSISKQSTLYYADSMWDLVKTMQDGHFQHYKAVHKGQREIHDFKTDMLGAYQSHNIKTVLAACDILSRMDVFELPQEKVLSALSKVKRLSGLRGRWEIIQQKPLMIADVAHNPAGLQLVMQQFANTKGAQKHIIAGFVRDKDVREALSFFPADAIYYFTQAAIPRALPVDELQQIADDMGLHGNVYPSISAAVEAAYNNLHKEDALLITGSFFIVGEALEVIGERRQNTEQAQLFS